MPPLPPTNLQSNNSSKLSSQTTNINNTVNGNSTFRVKNVNDNVVSFELPSIEGSNLINSNQNNVTRFQQLLDLNYQVFNKYIFPSFFTIIYF